MTYILVIDIGKTHIKLYLLDQQQRAVEEYTTANTTLSDAAPYPHFNIDATWHWLLKSIASLPHLAEIQAISITTHGATAALVNRDQSENGGLVLPVLDYEYTAVSSCDKAYRTQRPDFTNTFSPDLPAGLNLGRQLFWLQSTYPDQFSQASHILLYPQYWAWRFSAALNTEITSLGCHTDLWEPRSHCYSSLVKTQKWEQLFPPLIPAWNSVGCVTEAVAAATGLNERCKVFAGVHDSNASYLRYLSRTSTESFAVVSTGTWTIVMSADTPLDVLNSERDMLANVDINGHPVACSRFMGGREFELICRKLNANVNDHIDKNDIQKVINSSILALPNFSDGSGPFPKSSANFIGEVSQHSGIAIATIYCALVIDYQLDLLRVKGNIIIEGSFLKNPELCSLLAQLRENQTLLLSADSAGTVQGCAMLTQWENKTNDAALTQCTRSDYSNLQSYRNLWRSMVEA